MSRPTVATVAVVVLLSTLAGVAGGTPETGGSVGADALTTNEVAQQETTVDRPFQSGGTYWSGERLTFDASGIVSDDASEADRTFEVWRVADDGRLNQRVSSFTVDESGSHSLQTGDLAGRYVVRYGEQAVYVHDGVGYLESPPDGSSVTVDSAAFVFARQTLSFDWSDPTVYPGQRVTMTMTSNRDDFAVAASGRKLSFANLTEVFPQTAYADDFDARADEDVLLVRAGARVTYDLDTSALEPGHGALHFDVVDTATAETADLEILEPADDGRFVSLERRENVGDVVEANVSCSHCFLVLGGPDQGVLDVVELEDTNGDGHVPVRINTRYAGLYVGASGYPSDVEAYTSPTDSVNRYSSGAALEQVREELTYDVSTLNELREQEGLRSNGRTRPLPPGEYGLTIASSDFLIDRSAYGDRPPLGSQLVIRDEADVRTLTLRPRSLDGVEVLAVPDEPESEQTAARVDAVAAPREQVALGDDLVFRVDLSGVFGHLEAHETGPETLVRNQDEGIHLDLEQLADDSSGATTEVDLKRTFVRYLAVPSSESLYVVVETAESGPAHLQPGRYRLTIELSGVADKYARYSTSEGHRGYPYLDPGGSEVASAVATVAPAEAAITEPTDDAPHLNVDGDLVVDGTATTAAESELRVTATATEYSWDTGTTAVVNETGHWRGTLALAEAPGDEFTVTVTRDGEPLAERTYTVQPPTEDESSGGSAGSSGGGASGGPAGGVAEGGLLSGLSGLAGLAVPVGGGIGVIVFVWVLWRLVIRRLLL